MRAEKRDTWEATMRGTLWVLTALYLVNFLLLGWKIGPFDYNHLSTYYDLAWRFWRSQGGLPEFNPYLCGGRTLGGDPQLPIFHPLTLLVPILGPTWLIKIEMLAQLALGCWGLWQMLARFGVELPGRRWALFLYASGGAVVARFLVGHVTLGYCFLYPLFLALSYRLQETRGNRRRRVFVSYAALFVYCSLYKPNFLIYGVPPLLFEVLVRAWVARQPRVLIEFLVATALGAMVGAVSLLPAARYFSDFPRPDDGPPSFVPLYTLLANLLLPLKAIPNHWYGSRFLQRHEYNVFVGPVALWFAYRGWRLRPSNAAAHEWGLVALALISIVLGAGRGGEGFSLWVPYSWFQTYWPGFSSVRVSVRFWYGLSLAVIVWSAIGFRVPASRGRQIALLVLGILPLLLQAGVNLSKTTVQSKITQWVSPRLYPTQIVLKHAPPDEPYADVRAGRAPIECPSNLEIYPAPEQTEGDTLSTSTSRPAETAAHWVRWNRIALLARAAQPGELTVSLNMHHGDYWSFEGHGQIVSTRHQRLSVGAEDGVIAGQLVFRQPLVAESLRLSGLSLALYAAFGAWTFLPRRRRRQPLRLGLTGGVASGKSAAAAAIRELGIPVIDLDQVGKEITDRHPALLEEIKKAFGPEVVPQGKLDRRKMREIVFADETKRRKLERILHPPIRREFERECEAEERKGAPIVVCEAALLVEGGYYRHLDGLIVITAPAAVRQERLRARDNLTAELAEQMFRAQKTDEEKLKVATWVVENDGTREELGQKIQAIFKTLN